MVSSVFIPIAASPTIDLLSPFTKPLTFFNPLYPDSKTGKDLYDEQISALANSLLIEDHDEPVKIEETSANFELSLIFPDKALISGSFLMAAVVKSLCGADLKYDDIDIYVKSKDDAKSFLASNHMYNFSTFDNPMCVYGHHDGIKYNLIYGVEYLSPGDLIKRFDIRACSMALDPNSKVLYTVFGSMQDATRRRLVFNAVPRGISMRRYAKYIQKGFEADSYQNVFFTELLKTDIYKPELELLTKEY